MDDDKNTSSEKELKFGIKIKKFTKRRRYSWLQKREA